MYRLIPLWRSTKGLTCKTIWSGLWTNQEMFLLATRTFWMTCTSNNIFWAMKSKIKQINWSNLTSTNNSRLNKSRFQTWCIKISQNKTNKLLSLSSKLIFFETLRTTKCSKIEAQFNVTRNERLIPTYEKHCTKKVWVCQSNLKYSQPIYNLS